MEVDPRLTPEVRAFVYSTTNRVIHLLEPYTLDYDRTAQLMKTFFDAITGWERGRIAEVEDLKRRLTEVFMLQPSAPIVVSSTGAEQRARMMFEAKNHWLEKSAEWQARAEVAEGLVEKLRAALGSRGKADCPDCAGVGWRGEAGVGRVECPCRKELGG